MLSPLRTYIAAITPTSSRAGDELQQLVEQGTLSSVQILPRTGTAIVTMPVSQASEGWRALRSIDGIGRITRDHTIAPPEGGRELPGLVSGPAADTHPVGYQIKSVHADRLRRKGIDGTGVTIGFVDTGVDASHEALQSRYRGRRSDGTLTNDYSFFDAAGSQLDHPYDDRNHGTHVVGTALGDATGHHIGIAPGAQFIAAKVFRRGVGTPTSDVLRGLEWMLAPTDAKGNNPDPSKAPRIVNNSWGSIDGSSLDYLGVWKRFEQAGIVVVSSAGNGGPTAGSIVAPGSYPTSITVGAIDEQDRVVPFSSRGPSPIKDADGREVPKPDLVAPGSNIISSVGGDNAYTGMDGTSMATPIVTGVIALLLQRHPNLTPAQLRDIMRQSATDLGPVGFDHDSGYGKLDAERAMKIADQIDPQPRG